MRFALHELTLGAYRDILSLSTSERAFFRFWHHHCSPRIVVDQGGMPTGCPRGVRTGDATVCATRSRGLRRPGSARPGSVRAQGGSLPPPGHSYRPLLELSAWRARMAARSMGLLRPGGSAPHASPAWDGAGCRPAPGPRRGCSGVVSSLGLQAESRAKQ